ncbi:hypothetical protein CMPELA_18225 [Cupriavidus necator]|uniref:Uncharacterized protein n=1 Tax=Cupriavidus necator (strain ATCC 17699 / DSM 428 / KCTC 22496 / NCIMB 10442 / H16 / Stanier 337) TaxID=381666 RepID=Q0K5Q5_CUPNH|nr:hypothetical protein [Cupriavidus necator]QCC02408.1 hypothetical protein E6A55_18395 [Cupriavidus necator H16]QQB78185.1 hypothetical protein I6H87_07765 [Cupriavidus necator]WKA40815.1 hypothetical protein QWP09_18415 [Cupriavidus necator]CAJ94666.1 Hypothetical protein H16_A3608 [Cupriavidus necator H16]
MMLAFLPLPGWAAAFAHAEVATGEMSAAPAANIGNDDAAGVAATGEPSPASEAAEPRWQPGADLAEQLLPASPLCLAAWGGRAGPPRYAGAPLPEPDLPRLPRPPSA